MITNLKNIKIKIGAEMYCVITSTIDPRDQPQQVNVRSDKN